MQRSVSLIYVGVVADLFKRPLSLVVDPMWLTRTRVKQLVGKRRGVVRLRAMYTPSLTPDREVEMTVGRHVSFYSGSSDYTEEVLRVHPDIAKAFESYDVEREVLVAAEVSCDSFHRTRFEGLHYDATGYAEAGDVGRFRYDDLGDDWIGMP